MGGRGAQKPLVRCPIWASELIYPVRCAARDALSTIERRCPDCEHRDCARTNRLAAEIWHRRNGHVAMRLSAFPASFGFGDRIRANRAQGSRVRPAPDPAPAAAQHAETALNRLQRRVHRGTR
jgi:hypothetical protein